MGQGNITLSSSFEALVKALAEKVQQDKDALFASHLICLPDLKWKRVLTDALLNAQDIPMLSCVSWSDLAKVLLSMINKGKARPTRFPPKDVLSLHILALLESGEIEVEPPRALLVSKSIYYQNLATKLADSFVRFGKYGGQAIAPFLDSDSVLARAFKSVFTFWDYPYKEETTLSQEPITPFHLHVFNFPFIPKVYQEWLSHLPSSITVSFYQFSYCDAYWTDTLSDAQAVHALTQAASSGARLDQAKDLKKLLLDRNPLLANFGTLHLKMKKWVEESGLSLHERASSFDQNRLLGQLQSNIAANRGREGALFNTKDESLACLQFTSRRDEVKHLRARIEALMEQNPDIMAASITVYAPDMEVYKPFIKEYFQTSPALPHIFFDETLTETSSFIQTLASMLNVFSAPLTHTSLFKFFSEPFICEQFGWDEAEVETFSQLFKEAGFSLTLKESEKSFEKAFERLCRANLILPQEKPTFAAPFVGKCELERLASFASTVLDFSSKAELLLKNPSSLKAFYTEFLALISCFGSLEDMGSDGVGLKQVIELACSLDEEVQGHIFEPSALINYLLLTFNKLGTSQESSLNTIVCRSLNINTFYPTPVVFVLGLNQDDFPRVKGAEVAGMPACSDFAPSPTDEDRAVFLSLIMQTPRQLHLSYASYCEKTGVEMNPAYELAALSDYVYGQLPKLVEPAALAPATSKPSAHLLSWQTKQCLIKGVHRHHLKLRLSELHEFVSHPIRYHFRSVLGARLPFKERDVEERASFSVKKVQSSQNSEKTWQNTWQLAKAHALLPSGRFFDMAAYEIKQERLSFLEGLASLDINLDELFSIEFSSEYDKAMKEKGVLTYPKAVTCIDGLTLSIEGAFSHVCSKGLVLTGPASLENIVKHSAQICTFLSLEKSPYFEKRLLFLEGATSYQPEAYAKLCDTFFKWFLESRHASLPLLPKWSSYFAKQDVTGFEKALEKALYERLDPYLNHATLELSTLPLEAMIEKGSEVIENVFTPLMPHE